MPLLGKIEFNPDFGPMVHGTDGNWYFFEKPGLNVPVPPVGYKRDDFVAFEQKLDPSAPPGFLFLKDLHPPDTLAQRLAIVEVFPPEIKKALAPARKLTAEEKLAKLKSDIVDSRETLQATAEKRLSLAKGSSAELTCCFMWKSDSAWDKGTSGISGGGRLSFLDRQKMGASTEKIKTCAEENIFWAHGTQGWVYSLAYDHVNGWKSACKEGCRGLVAKHGIIDLAKIVKSSGKEEKVLKKAVKKS